MWLASFRAALRGLALPVLAAPLLPALLIALAGGQGETILGTLAGLLGAGGGLALLRRARRGDGRLAAVLLAVGTGLAGWLAAGAGPIGGVVLGLAAGIGARLAYEGLPEAMPEPGVGAALEPFAARLTSLEGADRRLAGPVSALRGLLREMSLRPALSGDARGVLVVGLDGLERIAGRLSRGASEPEGLTAATLEIERSAHDAGARLRAAETEALEVQVKVLRQRLREEGAA